MKKVLMILLVALMILGGTLPRTAMAEGEKSPEDWSLYFNSVIVFGRIRVIEDRQTTIDVARRLGLKYFPTVEMVDEDLARNVDRVACFELEIEHMTGKHVHEN